MTTTAKPRKSAKAARPPKPLESEVQKACIAVLESRGWRVFRRNTGAMSGTYNGKRRFVRFAEKGQADLYGFMPNSEGRHVEIEIKRPGERPTLDQVEWLLGCHYGHCAAFWVDSPKACLDVAMHIERGGEIRYPAATRAYPMTDKKGKKIGTIEGPSGDYELV